MDFPLQPPDLRQVQVQWAERYLCVWTLPKGSWEERTSWPREGLNLIDLDAYRDRPETAGRWGSRAGSPLAMTDFPADPAPVAFMPYDHKAPIHRRLGPVAWTIDSTMDAIGFQASVDRDRTAHFGLPVHEIHTSLDGRPAPLARWVQDHERPRWEPFPYRYRLEWAGDTLAWTHGSYPEAIVQGTSPPLSDAVRAPARPYAQCVTADGDTYTAWLHEPTAKPLPPLRDLPKHLRGLPKHLRVLPRKTLDERRASKAMNERSVHDQWIDGAVLGTEGGWEILDSTGRPIVWALPSGVGHRTFASIIGAHGTSMADLDPVVHLLAAFVLYLWMPVDKARDVAT